jgi:hypothetical protein
MASMNGPQRAPFDCHAAAEKEETVIISSIVNICCFSAHGSDLSDLILSSSLSIKLHILSSMCIAFIPSKQKRVNVRRQNSRLYNQQQRKMGNQIDQLNLMNGHKYGDFEATV